MAFYFKLKDLDTIGKTDADKAYIFDKTICEWRIDKQNTLMDRIEGFDAESTGPLEVISEREAMELIKQYGGNFR
ncbi:MAG: hypothetical protein ACOX8Q_04430 [Christensenellales bacterium]|jgi:hypothetical protein